MPVTLRDWGGSEQVADFGVEMYFCTKLFRTSSARNILFAPPITCSGRIRCSSVSYIAAIGTASKLHTYSNNRGDDSSIPGSMIPGYVVIKPDFPECITDFGMLSFEDETTVSAASWVLEANAAEALVTEKKLQSVRRETNLRSWVECQN